MSVYIFDSEWTDRKNPEIIEAAWLLLQNGRYFLSDNGIQHARPLVVESKFVQRTAISTPPLKQFARDQKRVDVASDSQEAEIA